MSVEQFAEQWSVGVSVVDGEAVHGEFGTWLRQAVQDGLTPGLDGWTDDLVALRSFWGFDPASISVSIKVWHGREDRIVPIVYGRWLVDTIPSAEAAIGDDDGHVTVVADRIGDVHDWLARNL